MLLWAHVLLGVATCSLYIYRVNLPLAASLAPNAGYFELWIALPIIVPYLASARFSWSAYSDPYVIHNRVRLAAFIFVLAMGAVFMGWFIASPRKVPNALILFWRRLCKGSHTCGRHRYS